MSYTENINYQETCNYINPEIKCLIIGDGPDYPKLKNMSKGKNIKFIRRASPPKVLSHISRSKALVFPSLYGEGLPNVILESFSVGTPVISTNTAGIGDILEHNVNGFLVKPKDKEKLAYYIDKLLLSEAVWKRISSNNIIEIKKYGWDIITPQFHNSIINLV